jgi:uncharacterized membrane protein YdjX (TVP38/TMEM64 family)
VRRAISYYLGLTPIRFSAYIAGTAAGRGFWALLYASIGAYSRTWMQRGIGLDGVLQGGRNKLTRGGRHGCRPCTRLTLTCSA